MAESPSCPLRNSYPRGPGACRPAQLEAELPPKQTVCLEEDGPEDVCGVVTREAEGGQPATATGREDVFGAETYILASSSRDRARPRLPPWDTVAAASTWPRHEIRIAGRVRGGLADTLGSTLESPGREGH